MDTHAKRHRILETIRKELAVGFLEKTVDIGEHKFHLRTLNEDDEVWADQFIRAITASSLISSRRAPRLAAAIKSIDGIPLEELFQYPDEMDKLVKVEMDNNKVAKKYWLYGQMLQFLTEDSIRVFIAQLFEAFEKLEEERGEALNNVPLFSKKTPSGELKDSSLPEKESSSPILP
jgi:hypothetical protein